MGSKGDSERRSTRTNKVESRREREFYKYFDPVFALSGREPVYCDVLDSAAVQRHVPVASPDRTLTALCQLAALRLKARRAMLFCFTLHQAYVLAESTPTHSLPDEARDGDDLWLGYATIDRKQSVCDQTIRLTPTPDPDGAVPLNIISDLSEDVKFCGLPYVAGAPHTKFYAGVPITTSRGINIGAFCILDDTVRSDLLPDEKAFLRLMSANIMTHLEQVRAQSYHLRGMRMVKALDAFVEGNTTRQPVNYLQPERSFDTSAQDTQHASDSDTPRQIPSGRRKKGIVSQDNNEDVESDAATTKDLRERGLERLQDPVPEVPSASLKDQPHLPLLEIAEQGVAGSTADELHGSIVASNVATTFGRAARLLRDALDVEQVQFLDASVGGFGELVREQNQDEGSGSSHTGASTDQGRSKTDSQDPNKACYVLGESRHDSVEAVHPSIVPVSERFLNRLLRKYPNGKIWNTNFSEESTSSDDAGVRTADLSDKPTPKKPNSKRSQGEEDERVHMGKIYPSAQSLAVCGLWDHRHNKWFAACVLWTSSELRLLSNEGELNFVSAFCDVVMAEVHRLEIERSDRAKTDFISSISHELRSPLHGILGSAELLLGQPLDDFSEALAIQVSTCGRSLLDIIDNLLDYSNINFKSKRNRSRLQKIEILDQEPGSSIKTTPPPSSMMILDGDVALDEVTEGVVNSSITSFRFTHAASNADSVTTILDLEEPLSRCKLAVGGWKRICLNIVTNALKHTREGHVYIGLKNTTTEDSYDRLAAVLTVADSGKGMSKDFIANDLFAAFKQEDTFQEGTGLGMHIVARIVKAFGGTIDVQSDQIGGGTRVTVTVPLEAGDTIVEPGAMSPTRHTMPDASALPVGIVNCASSSTLLSAVCRKARTLQIETLQKTCRGLGLVVSILDDWNVMESAHLSLVTEADLSHLLQSEKSTGEDGVFAKPMVVICHDIKSEQELRLVLKEVLSNRIAYIREPAGPAQIAKAIDSLLEDEPPGGETTPAEIDTQLGGPTGHAPESTRKVPVEAPGKDESLEMPAVSFKTRSRAATPSLDRSGRRRLNSTHSSSSPRPPALTLLVVEDNKVNQQLLVAYGRKQGHHCITANNGQEAIEVYKEAVAASTNVPSNNGEQLPLVILMDINMPVLNGFESMRQIRVYERRNGLEPARIIALTGLGSADAQREAHTSGCDVFLTKPVQFTQLSQFLSSTYETRVH